MGSFRRVLAPAGLLTFGFVLAFGLIEGALRIYDSFKPDSSRPRAQLWVPKLGYGWLHPPGASGRYFDDRGEFSVHVTMSSQGLRDVDHEYAKPADVYRILVLGDSYMEAVQVELEQILPRLLEKELRAGGRKVEVINGSAAEWGTDNQLVFFREEGVKYAPDLVLLAFTTANDVRNNSVALNHRVPSPNPYKPTFTVSADGALEYHPMTSLPPPFPPGPWWNRSRAAVFFANRLGLNPPLPPPPAAAGSKPAAAAATVAGAAAAPSPPAAAQAVPPVATPPVAPAVSPPSANPSVAPSAPAANVPTDMLVYAPAPTPEIVDAWRVTKALVLELRREAEQHGARFAMFLVNGPWAHYDDYWTLMTLYDRTARETWDRRKPNHELAPFLVEKKIPSLDLLGAFEAKKSGERLYFRYDPHFSAAGHRVAAQAVARFLVDEGLVRPPAAAGAER